MRDMDPIIIHEIYAHNYDSQVKDYNSYQQELLFGMCYEYVKARDSLLDIGIGTGLSSINFAKAGLNVFGMDASKGMLEECKKKKFTIELKQHSITKIPLPYSNNSFSFIICSGLFHFFGDLLSIFGEVNRILNPSGIFAFSIASISERNIESDNKNKLEYIKMPSNWGVPIFKHSDIYIDKLMEAFGLSIAKEQKTFVASGDKNIGDILFKIIIAQKNNRQ